MTSFDIPGPGGTTEKVQIGNIENYAAVLSVSQPIYAGGAIQSQVRSARLFSLQTDEVIRGATQEAVYQAETAYYDLLRNQHLVEIATDAARSAGANLEDVEKRRAGGVVADFDVLQAQVELSNREADLSKTGNAIDIARANLIRIMGVAQGSDFVLSEEFTFVPVEISMEQAVETALKNRPDLYGQEYRDPPAEGAAADCAQPLLAGHQRVLRQYLGQARPEELRRHRDRVGRYLGGGNPRAVVDLRRLPARRRDHSAAGPAATGSN